MFRNTPLAWKNLVGDRRRLLIGISGVAFAAVLMFVQNGFRNALLDSPVQLLQSMNADLVAVSRARYALPSEQRFPAQLLQRAQQDPDVVRADPVYLEMSRASVRVAGGGRRSIRVVAVPLRPDIFNQTELQLQLPLLAAPGVALLDRKTRPAYGFDVHPEPLSAQRVELVNSRVQIVGTVAVGADFANEGTLFQSPRNFAQTFSFRGGGDPLSIVDLGLIRLRADADPVSIAARLTYLDPRAWRVITKQQLIDGEVAFWNQQTPIGMIFFIGAVMGFAVGVIICYQILYTNVSDAMPEFATLKAMGYGSWFFVWVVVRQATYLALLGFVPAVLISLGLFQLLENAAGLPMMLTVGRVSVVLVMTLSMCLISGVLALRKLIAADPAALF